MSESVRTSALSPPGPAPSSSHAAPTPERSGSLFALRDALGNRGFGAFLQAQLTVGSSDDPYETEADQVADHVMRMSEPSGAPPEIRPLSSDSGHRVRRQVEADKEVENEEQAEEDLTDNGELTVQRKCAACEGEEEGDDTIQRQADDELEGAGSADEEDDTVVQTKRQSPAGPPPIAAGTASRVRSLHGHGDPLSPSLRAYFEPRFGRDFGSVRTHTGGDADATSRALGARAYTVGSNIAFRHGAYAPHSDDGRRLLAHELTHVAQQGSADIAVVHTAPSSSANLRSELHSSGASPAIGRACACGAKPTGDEPCGTCSSHHDSSEAANSELPVSSPGTTSDRDANRGADHGMLRAPVAPRATDGREPARTIQQGSSAPGPAPRSTVSPDFPFTNLPIQSAAARLHHDDQAAAVARAADARAVTIGRDIYFGRGEHQPSTPRGRELLAHELVHVAQASRGTRGDRDAAESEATRLAPLIASGDGGPIDVAQQAAPLMCDPIPEPDLNQDRKKIRAELVTRYPWLAKLANRDLVETTFADFIALKRRNIELTRELNRLPDPKGTYLSEEIDRREARRRPVERKLGKVMEQERDTPKNIRVDLRSLLTKDFLPGSSALDTAGREAVVAELANHRGSVGVWRHGLNSFGFSLGVFINGVWIPAEDDGITLGSFFAERYAYYSLLAVQSAYYSGRAGSARKQLEAKVDQNPWLAEAQLRALHEESAEARRQKFYPTEEEELVLAYRSAKKDYSDQVTAKTQAAIAPFVLVLGIFAVEGPVDLLLAVAPVHKLGKAFTLGKDAMAARRTRKAADKLVKEFGEHLDDEAKAFLKTASKLSKAEVKALKKIHAAVGSQSVITTLMDRSIRGTADLTWIAKKLDSKKIDGDFVRTFTEFEAAPSWKAFQSVVEKQPISADARAGLASQLVGFLGEEAAAKMAKTDVFAKAVFKGRKGAKLTVTQGAKYGDNKSFDLLGVSDKAELVFGEVKNWAAGTWSTASKRTEIIDQLKRHNAGVPEVTSALYRRSSDVQAKVLFVADRGFKDGLDAKAAMKFRKEVSELGWDIQLIPESEIADFGSLIDRLR